MEGMKDPTSQADVTFSVREVTKGVPSRANIVLAFGGVPAPKISTAATDMQVSQ